MVEFPCPSGEVSLRLRNDKPGKTGRCPHCRSLVRGPSAAPTVTAAPDPGGFEVVDDDAEVSAKPNVTANKPAPRSAPAVKADPKRKLEQKPDPPEVSPVEDEDEDQPRKRRRKKK